MQLLDPDEYHQMLCFYMIACQAQKEVRNYEKALGYLIEDKSLFERLGNMIYDSSSNGTKKEFDNFIFENGISIKWKPTQTKFAKEPKEETNVGW